MYRRVNSGGFIGAMTLGIVIVMAIFTWVMYGMARQVYILTDVMLELNDSFKAMVVDMDDMSTSMLAMRDAVVNMDGTMNELLVDMDQMNGNMAVMTGDMGSMSQDMGKMTNTMGAMTNSMQAMTVSITRMTSDVGRASHAFSNPMSYMFGGGPFPF